MVEWGELSFKIVRLEQAGQEVLARAGNFLVARAAFQGGAFLNHVIVRDIETVPDIQGFAAANRHEGKSDDEVRVALVARLNDADIFN